MPSPRPPPNCCAFCLADDNFSFNCFTPIFITFEPNCCSSLYFCLMLLIFLTFICHPYAVFHASNYTPTTAPAPSFYSCSYMLPFSCFYPTLFSCPSFFSCSCHSSYLGPSKWLLSLSSCCRDSSPLQTLIGLLSDSCNLQCVMLNTQ